jgi:DNA-binding beta-propeller fold protein YncE
VLHTRLLAPSVRAQEPDPDASNTQATETIEALAPDFCGPQGGDCTPAVGGSAHSLGLVTRDLVYDRMTHQIYASIPSSAGAAGNSVTAIDPVTGAIGSPLFAGSEPGTLALSDDGQYLYVALDGAADATFPVTTRPVTAPTDVVFSATASGMTRTATLRVQPR